MCPIEPTPQQVADELARFSNAVRDLTPSKPADHTPAPEPVAPLSSKVGSLNSSKQPSMSVSEAQAGRETWAKTFVLPTDRVLTLAEADAALAAHMARFDEAMRLDGMALPKAPDAQAVKAAAAYGLPHDPKPSDYLDFKKPDAFTPQPGSVSEMADFAAALGFSKDLGQGVLSHLAEIGPAYARMSDTAKTEWLNREQMTGIRLAGGEKQYNAVRDSAVKLLKELAGHKPMTSALINSPQFNSWWLLQTLATHAGNRAAFAARRR